MIDKDFFTYTKLSGVTYKNDKDLDIQNILPLLKEEGRIYCIRDYSNEYDSNAIKVYYFTQHESIHIGYIKRELAVEIAPFLDEHPECDLDGAVEEVTGGNGNSYGCNIRLWIQSPDEPSYEEIKNFQEQQEQYKKQNAKTPRKRITPFHVWLTIILILIPIGLFASIYLAKNLSSDINYATPKENVVDETLITLNEFERLRTGMSRDEVYEIIGSYGTLVSESSTEDYRVKMYSYEGYGTDGANAQLLFTNGELETKAQAGLEYYYNKESGTKEKLATSPLTTPENEVPVKISNLLIRYTILPPDSIGTVYMEGTYTNNSKYAITSFSLTVLLKDKNDKTYLSCYDTVLPGETSPIFDSFGPDSRSPDDVEFLECSLQVIDETGDSKFIDYDYKLKTYSVIG